MRGDNRLYQWLSDWLQQQRQPAGMRLSDFERVRQELHPCDVLLVDGSSRLDQRIKRLSNSRWSRALLYLGRLHDIDDPALRAILVEYQPCEADTQLVMEASLDRGLILQPLTNLEPGHMRICRPRGLSHHDAQEVIRFAVSRLGLSSGPGWMDILRLFVPWQLIPRRWRLALFARMAGRLLRTLTGTSVGDAFAFIQYPVLPLVKHQEDGATRLYRRHPQAFFAADFDHSPYFDVIKYAFVDQTTEHRGERLLPWKGSHGALSGEEEERPRLQVVEDSRKA
jgi:hypothetical protein